MPHVAKWWQVYLFDVTIRRLILNPEPIFRPYVEPGMTVLDVGCGAGSNALCLARLVGESGRVIAADMQQKLLEIVAKRSKRAGLAECIAPRLCLPDSIGVDGPVDFVNAFWMLHETPDQPRFLEEVSGLLRRDGKLLAVEPRGHVSEAAFQTLIESARDAGLALHDTPRVRFSRAAVFTKERSV